MSKNNVIICYNRKTLKPITIPQEDRFLNMLIIGPTGTGKTSQVFIPMIFQDLTNPNVGITIFDPKEELANRIVDLATKIGDRKVIYVDPTDIGCPKIDLFKGSADEIIRTLIKIFVIQSKGDTYAERAIQNITRNLIEKSINLLKNFPNLCGSNLNVDTYCDFISNKYNTTKIKIQKQLDSIRNTSNLDRIGDCKWFLDQYFELETGIFEKCTDFRSKIEELSTNYYLSEVFMADKDDKNTLDFDKHISNGDVVIINTKNTLLGYLGKTFGEILMYLYVISVFKRLQYNKSRNIRYLKPNFLYIDEFASFSPVTIDLFTQGRIFKIGTHIAIQNRTLLKMCGNYDTTSEAFVIESNTRNLILFPGLNGEDADYYSKQFFNLTSAEILYRPFGQIVYKIVRDKNTIPPSVGLVFFIDERPNGNSIAREFEFDEKGNIVWNKFDDYINDDFE